MYMHVNDFAVLDQHGRYMYTVVRVFMSLLINIIGR